MKKVVFLITLISLFANIMIPAQAIENEYTYVDNDVEIITPESFEDEFEVDSVRSISYNYEIVILEENNLAIAALNAEINIDGVKYTMMAQGTVKAYQLPSGDVLWEGPLDGNLNIGKKQYNLIAGFLKLASKNEVMINLSLQRDSCLVAISFGEKIIKGEVLDFIMERTSSNTEIFDSSIDSIDTASSLGGTPNISVNRVLPGFSVIEDPAEGDDIAHLGAFGQYKYQSTAQIKHTDSSYNALESSVYFYQGKSDLLVTVKPFCQETQDYAESLHYDFVASTLYSMDVKLELDSSVGAEQFAGIWGIEFPETSEFFEDNFGGSTELVVGILTDYLSLKCVPTATITALIDGIKEEFEAGITGTNDSFKASIHVDSFVSPELIEEISSGLATHFYLFRPNPDFYEGDTPYTVTSTVKYYVFTQTNVPLSEPSYAFFFVEKEASHNGTIDL